MKFELKAPHSRMAAVMAASVALSACASVGMEQRLQKLEDRVAIEQVIFGEYPRALDGRDWKAYAATFAREGVLVQGTTETKGPEAIEAYFSRPRPPRTPPAGAAAPAAGAAPAVPASTTPPSSKHVISNLKIISLTADRAETTAYWETVSTRSTGTVIAGAGHYNDTLIKEDGKWKFLRREIVNPARGAAPAASAAPAAPTP
jgi:3-phenylpropionate/cinnamic acid dioxygenase small subunit